MSNNYFDINFLSETCVNAEFCFRDYIILRCDSESRHTGGVIIYVKENLKTEIIQSLQSIKMLGCSLREAAVTIVHCL